jgi:RNA polymerase sigma factor (sigma-70 family)
MTNEEFVDVYYPKYRHLIAGIARKYARNDEELFDDLKQEGAFALLKLRPERARVNLDAWIRQAIKFRMIDYLRKLRLRDTCSLQQFLENGSQVAADPDGGDAQIINWRPAPGYAPGLRPDAPGGGRLADDDDFPLDDEYLPDFRAFLGERE